MRPFATCLCESTVRVGPDSELIDRRTRRIEEVARCFKYRLDGFFHHSVKGITLLPERSIDCIHWN